MLGRNKERQAAQVGPVCSAAAPSPKGLFAFFPPSGVNLASVFEEKRLPVSAGIWFVSQLCGGPAVVLRSSSGSGFTFSAWRTTENMHDQHPP